MIPGPGRGFGERVCGGVRGGEFVEEAGEFVEEAGVESVRGREGEGVLVHLDLV